MMKTYMTNWLKVTKIDKNNKQKYNNISAMLLSTVGQFGNISLWKFQVYFQEKGKMELIQAEIGGTQ